MASSAGKSKLELLTENIEKSSQVIASSSADNQREEDEDEGITNEEEEIAKLSKLQLQQKVSYHSHIDTYPLVYSISEICILFSLHPSNKMNWMIILISWI